MSVEIICNALFPYNTDFNFTTQTSDMDLSLDPSNESLDSGSSGKRFIYAAYTILIVSTTGLKKARPKKPETEEEFASFFPFSLDFSHTTALPENPGISSYKSIEYYSPTQNSMTARILLASITVSMLIALLTRRRGYLYRRFRGSTKPSLPSIGTKV